VVLFVNAAVSPSVLSLCVSSAHAFPELPFIIQGVSKRALQL
jgi:hypothetical protein